MNRAVLSSHNSHRTSSNQKRSGHDGPKRRPANAAVIEILEGLLEIVQLLTHLRGSQLKNSL